MSLVVARAIGLVTVQDLGRAGHMHEAVPPGGALVRGLLVAANGLVGNACDAPALEVCGVVRVRAEADVVVGAAGGSARLLHAGEELELASEPRRVAYLAVRGGIESPLVLGGRGTLLCAGLGRIVRAGDVLGVAGGEVHRGAGVSAFDERAAIRVLPGPDGEAFAGSALDVLVAGKYRVRPDSDRVGTRLAGAAIPRVAGYVEKTRPLVRGAIEVPGDGQPIVLGPEHPTTGGYPVIGVVASEDLDAFHAVRLGGDVRFEVRGH